VPAVKPYTPIAITLTSDEWSFVHAALLAAEDLEEDIQDREVYRSLAHKMFTQIKKAFDSYG